MSKFLIAFIILLLLLSLSAMIQNVPKGIWLFGTVLGAAFFGFAVFERLHDEP